MEADADDDGIDDAVDDSNGGAEVEMEVATVEPAYLCRGFSTDVQVGLANVPPLLLPVLLMFAAAAATVGDCGAREIVCKYETAVATAAAAAAADALPLPPPPPLLLDCVPG